MSKPTATGHYTVNKPSAATSCDAANAGDVTQPEAVSWYRRQDFWVWVSGLVYILALLGAMFCIGIARGWDATSGFTHNESVTSQERFLPEPDPPEPGVRGRYGPEATSRWYYWKVRPENLTFWTHFFPWICYLGHQVLMWGAIYRAQMVKALEPGGKGRYTTDMSTFNWFSLVLNILFHLLHLVQTHVTYDGTAQDVSIATSQGSVIMLVVLIVVMEYRQRGLFFGWPTTQNKDKISRTLRLDYGPVNLIRRYHGYAFAWAAIYTFWYHPMENTWGHALGFFYTWILLLQGTLMYTRLHLNLYWRLLTEVFVIIHGGVVASQTGGIDLGGTRLWPMFTFGFALVFVITQIFSLPVWVKLPTAVRLLPLGVYMGIVVWCYSWIEDDLGRPWVRMAEILRIPSVYYLYFPVTWALIYACLVIEKRCNGPEGYSKAARASPTAHALWLSAAMLVYGVHVGLAISCEYADVQLGLIVLMIGFVGIFIIGVTISTMFLKQTIPYRLTTADGMNKTDSALQQLSSDGERKELGTTNHSFREDMELK